MSGAYSGGEAGWRGRLHWTPDGGRQGKIMFACVHAMIPRHGKA